MKALRDLIMDGKMPDRSSGLYNALWVVTTLAVLVVAAVVER